MCAASSLKLKCQLAALRDSQRCEHVDDVCAVLLAVADQVRHFPQVLRRQPVAPLQPAQKTCFVDIDIHTAQPTLLEFHSGDRSEARLRYAYGRIQDAKDTPLLVW